MKSGLEGRNKARSALRERCCRVVSMKSGLEGRNKGVGNAWMDHQIKSQ